ncbi:MAG: hypothetical protein ACLU4N_16065 [Butyricimonas faecihominis]
MYPYLISQILKGVWFLRPEDAIAGHVIVNNILTGVYRDEKFAKTLSEITPIQQLSHEGESSYDKSPKGSTAIISVKGTMIKYGTFCSYGADEIATDRGGCSTREYFFYRFGYRFGWRGV